MGWAHIRGGLISVVGSYQGWAHTRGGLISRVDSHQGWAHIRGGLISGVGSYQGWAHTRGGLISRVGSYQGWAHIRAGGLSINGIEPPRPTSTKSIEVVLHRQFHVHISHCLGQNQGFNQFPYSFTGYAYITQQIHNTHITTSTTFSFLGTFLDLRLRDSLC